MVQRNDFGKIRFTDKYSSSSWLLAIGTGLAGFSFGLNARDHGELEATIEPPALAKAVEFPENLAPGIASIHVHEKDLKDPERIVKEFEQTHPNLDVIAYEPQRQKVIHSGTMHQLKVVYRLKFEE